MKWEVELHEDLYKEFLTMEANLQDEILAKSILLEKYGPHLGRPHVDTLKSSFFPNMKELRLQTNRGIWRVTFAFDPERKAILLIAGNKKGKDETLFYIDLIKQSDLRFRRHLRKLKK